MTTRGTLLGIGAIFCLAALGCWIRARGNWRLASEGWLFLLLAAPFLVAGWFYSASSYPQEVITATPSPTPNAAATPVPVPTPTPRPYMEAVLASQKAAVAKYPDLGRAGTRFNARYVAAYHRLQADEPFYFSNPEWPMRLADEIARTQPRPR